MNLNIFVCYPNLLFERTFTCLIFLLFSFSHRHCIYVHIFLFTNDDNMEYMNSIGYKTQSNNSTVLTHLLPASFPFQSDLLLSHKICKLVFKIVNIVVFTISSGLYQSIYFHLQEFTSILSAKLFPLQYFFVFYSLYKLVIMNGLIYQV